MLWSACAVPNLMGRRARRQMQVALSSTLWHPDRIKSCAWPRASLTTAAQTDAVLLCYVVLLWSPVQKVIHGPAAHQKPSMQRAPCWTPF